MQCQNNHPRISWEPQDCDICPMCDLIQRSNHRIRASRGLVKRLRDAISPEILSVFDSAEENRDAWDDMWNDILGEKK